MKYFEDEKKYGYDDDVKVYRKYSLEELKRYIDFYIEEYKLGINFNDLLDNPINVMDFKLSYLKNNKDLNSSVDAANYVNSVIEALKKIDDETLVEISLKKLSEESKLDIDFLRDRFSSIEEVKEVKPVVKEKKEIDMYDKAQMWLIYYMFNYDFAVEMYDKEVTYMPNDKFRKLATYISCFYKEHGFVKVADLMTYLYEFDGMKEAGGAWNAIWSAVLVAFVARSE